MAAELYALATEAARTLERSDITAFLSKLCGLGVVCGSAILKAPQIWSVYRARSAAGLPAWTVEAEIAGYFLLLASSLAFSAYGEQAFLLFQNLVLLILIYYFSKQTSRLVYASSGYAALVALLASGALNKYSDLFVVVSTVILLSARAVQVHTNFQAKSTGALSGFTTLLQFGGGAVRVFTTFQEGGGGMLVFSYVLGMCLSGCLLIQIVAFGGAKKATRIKVPTRRSTARIRTKLA